MNHAPREVGHSTPTDLRIRWHIRDLPRWIDQDCIVYVEAWIEDGGLEWRIVYIFPDDIGFETWSPVASSAAQKMFYLYRGIIENDPDFARAVSDAAYLEGLIVEDRP
jgi:hypothetical protein